MLATWKMILYLQRFYKTFHLIFQRANFCHQAVYLLLILVDASVQGIFLISREIFYTERWLRAFGFWKRCYLQTMRMSLKHTYKHCKNNSYFSCSYTEVFEINIHLTSHLYEVSRVETLPGGIHGTLVFTLAVGRKPLLGLTWSIKIQRMINLINIYIGFIFQNISMFYVVGYFKEERVCYTWGVLVGLLFEVFFTCTCTGVLSFTCTCSGGEEERVLIDLLCKTQNQTSAVHKKKKSVTISYQLLVQRL